MTMTALEVTLLGKAIAKTQFFRFPFFVPYEVQYIYDFVIRFYIDYRELFLLGSPQSIVIAKVLPN